MRYNEGVNETARKGAINTPARLTSDVIGHGERYAQCSIPCPLRQPPRGFSVMDSWGGYDDLRRCSVCRGWYPATHQFFYSDKQRKDGMSGRCVFCQRKKARKYAAEHREEARLRARRWAEENPEKYRENQRRYRAENKEQLVLYNRRWRNENKERARQHSRRWRKRNPQKAKEVSYRYNANHKLVGRVRAQRRRARVRGARGTYSAADIQAIYERQGGRCWWCGTDVGTEYDIDHRVPLVQGGSNDVSNIVVACPSCNRSKGGKMPYEWNGRLL